MYPNELKIEVEEYKKLVHKLKPNHVFVLVEEAHADVIGTTKFPEFAVDWFESSAEHQSRWFNPAVYVCNWRPSGGSECSVPKTAIPILSTYSHLREGISEIRREYLKSFPNKLIEEAGKRSH